MALRIREEILDFAEEMEKKMSENDTWKGNSWKTMNIKYLELLLTKEYEELDGNLTDIDEYPDIANFCMMLWNRLNDGLNEEEK